MAGPEKWYFTREKLTNSPSKRCGLDVDTELSHRQQAANLIQDMGQRLQVSQLCINTAIVYMHRFYAFHSFSHFHRNAIAAAALFLAAKVEEQPRKLEYVIKVAHMCLHRNDRAPALDVRSEHYQEQAQDLVFNENVLLQTLGFDVAIDHPHTHVLRTCQLVKAPRDLVQTSYFMASNSLHLTTMCLQHKPTVVACFCIHLASLWSNWAIPQSNEGHPWFYYVDRSVTTELLEKLTSDFLQIFDKYPSRLKKRMMSLNSSAAGISSPHSGITAQQPLEGSSGGQQTPLQPPIASSPFDHKKGVVTTDDIEKFDKEYEKRHLSGYATAPLTGSLPPAQFAHQPHLPNKLDYREYREKKEREERERRSREQAGAAPRPQQPHPNRHHSSSSAHPIGSSAHPIGSSAHPIGSSTHPSGSSAHPSVGSTHASGISAHTSSGSSNPAAAAGHHRQWPGAHHLKHGPQPHPSKIGQQPVPRPSSSNRPAGTHHHHRHHPPNMPQPTAAPEVALAAEPPRQRPPSLFSPENTTPVAPKKPTQTTVPSSSAPIRRTSSVPHPNHLQATPAVPLNAIQGQIPSAPVPAKIKRPEPHIREMAPPPPLSPFRSPLSSSVSSQASNLMVTPPSNKGRTRTSSSSSSEPELIPVVKKLEETPGYENIIRDSQRHTAIRVKPERPPVSSPPRPSLNGIETDPALVSSLLKESLSRVPPSNLLTADSANFLDKSANEANHHRTQTNHGTSIPSLMATQLLHPSTIPEAALVRLVPDPEKVIEVTQSAPGEPLLDAHHPHRRSEKKKKKEKHKHKDRDKDKSREERKKHKKDKEREKKRQETGTEVHEHSISVPDSQPASLTTIKIMIPRDKLAVSPGSTPGFKIKIPKDRIERVPATAPPHSQSQQLPSTALKIKISKDVLDGSRKRSAMPSDEQPTSKTQRHNGLGHRDKVGPPFMNRFPPPYRHPHPHFRRPPPPVNYGPPPPRYFFPTNYPPPMPFYPAYGFYGQMFPPHSIQLSEPLPPPPPLPTAPPPAIPPPPPD